MRGWILISLLLLAGTAYATDQTGHAVPPNWPWHAVNMGFHDGPTPDDLVRFHRLLNINAVRLQITARKYAKRNEISGDQAFQLGLEWADVMLDACAKLGITAELDVSHFPTDPTRPGQTTPDFWKDQGTKDGVVIIARQLAEHFHDRGNELAAYDIMSEPVLCEGGKAHVPPQWPDLLSRIVKAIREFDSQRWIVVAPGPWGGPKGYRNFIPPHETKLIWGVHMYVPHAFTHQGIKGRGMNVEYPGLIRLRFWNKGTIRRMLEPLRQFQQKRSGPVWVGEFSAVRWAKGGEQYIRDLVSIFDEFSWGWAYFSATGWHGWNPDYNQHYPGNDGDGAWRKDYVGDGTARWQTLRTIFGVQQRSEIP